MRGLTASVFFLQVVLAVSAQPLYNDGLITLNGIVLYVGDSVVNAGMIANNGQIHVGGSWRNYGEYVPGNGQVVFRGPGQQTIDNRGQSFARVRITGGGKKVLLSDLVITDQMDFQSGNVEAGGGARVVFHADAFVLGGSDASHVVGSVVWHGDGTWLFPVGNPYQYLPMEISGITDQSAVGVVQEMDCNANFLQADTRSIAAVSSRRLWSLSGVSGSLEGSRISLPVRDESNLLQDPFLIVVSGADALPGPFFSLGQYAVQGDKLAGRVTSRSSPAAGFYAVASLAVEIPPLEVFNAVSPNSDHKNEFMRIKNIEYYPENTVSIFNRWGDKVFEVNGYNNEGAVFRGESNLRGNTLLPSGTYFYKITLGNDSHPITGYLALRH